MINRSFLGFCKRFYSELIAGMDAPKVHNPNIHRLRHFDFSNLIGCWKKSFPLIAFGFLRFFSRLKALIMKLQIRLILSLSTLGLFMIVFCVTQRFHLLFQQFRVDCASLVCPFPLVIFCWNTSLSLKKKSSCYIDFCQSHGTRFTIHYFSTLYCNFSFSMKINALNEGFLNLTLSCIELHVIFSFYDFFRFVSHLNPFLIWHALVQDSSYAFHWVH